MVVFAGTLLFSFDDLFRDMNGWQIAGVVRGGAALPFGALFGAQAAPAPAPSPSPRGPIDRVR